jgi:lactoylglutathione lyase
MNIKHVAMWTKDLETEKQFYAEFFGAVPNNKYVNTDKGFSSYFLNFNNSCGLELMHNDSIPENSNDRKKQYTGLIHLAISVGSKENVDSKTEELTEAGYELLSGPRWTGDGYYESCIYDPEGNRIEITI